LGVADFLINIKWMKKGANGDYQITRKGRIRSINRIKPEGRFTLHV
jgi:hypothetical protein